MRGNYPNTKTVLICLTPPLENELRLWSKKSKAKCDRMFWSAFLGHGSAGDFSLNEKYKKNHNLNIGFVIIYDPFTIDGLLTRLKIAYFE